MKAGRKIDVDVKQLENESNMQGIIALNLLLLGESRSFINAQNYKEYAPFGTCDFLKQLFFTAVLI
jgi:hypothetical protein